MRRYALSILIVVSMVLVAGCGGSTATPTVVPTDTAAPTLPPTEVSTADEVTPSAEGASVEPASCVVEPFDLPVETRIPPISDEDYTHGPADASITVIEYADFQ